MTLVLGGNIQLTGFRDLDPATLVIVKKVVGNFVKNVSTVTAFNSLNVTLKSVHEREKSEKYELHAHLKTDNKVHTSYVVERNLLVGLDAVLKKVEKEMRPRE